MVSGALARRQRALRRRPRAGRAEQTATPDVCAIVRWSAWPLLLSLVACAPGGRRQAEGATQARIPDVATGRIAWHVPHGEVAAPVTLFDRDGMVITPQRYHVEVRVDDPWVETTLTITFSGVDAPEGVAAAELRLPSTALLREVRCDGDTSSRADLLPSPVEATGLHRVALAPVMSGADPHVVARFTQLRAVSPAPLAVPLVSLPWLEHFGMHATIVDDDGRDSAELTFERDGYEPSADMHLLELSARADVGLRDDSRAVLRTAAAFTTDASPVDGLTIVWDASHSASLARDRTLARLAALIEALGRTGGHFAIQVVVFDGELRRVALTDSKDSAAWLRPLQESLDSAYQGHGDLVSSLEDLAATARLLLVSDAHAPLGTSEPDRLATMASELAAAGVRRIDALAPAHRSRAQTLLAFTAAPGLTPGLILDPADPPQSNLYALTRVPRVNVPVTVGDDARVWPEVVPRLLPGDEVLAVVEGVDTDDLSVRLGTMPPRRVPLRRRPQAVLDEVMRAARHRVAVLADPLPPAKELRRDRLLAQWIDQWTDGRSAALRYAALGGKKERIRYAHSAQRLVAVGFLGLDAEHRQRARALLEEAQASDPGSFAGARLLAWATLEIDAEAAFERMLAARDQLVRRYRYRFEAHELAEIDLSLLAAVWWHRTPGQRRSIEARLLRANVAMATEPISMAVMSWEGLDDDADLYVHLDEATVFFGNRSLDASGGLITDSTSSAIPEAFVQRGDAGPTPAELSVDCHEGGETDSCTGGLQLIFYDGRGQLQTRFRPWSAVPRRGGASSLGLGALAP